MAKVTKATDETLMFWCPGCEEAHGVKVDGSRGWGWNGSLDLPTITPSILVRSGHHIPEHKGPCWCTFDWGGRKPSFECKICHSFVTDGKIQFLGDCSHALAGQTVELPEWGSQWED